MFSTKAIALAAAAMAFATVGVQSANAQYRGGGLYHPIASAGVFDARIANQARRIRFGQRTGRINRVEARKLRFELSYIRGFKYRYMRDGRLNHREARHLNRLLDSNSRQIRRFATNGNRGWRHWRRNGRNGRVGLGRFNGFRT